MAERFSGVHWMLATPFHEDESIDTASIGKIVAKAISSGCQGMVCLGVTGEVARLTDRERHQVADAVIQRAEGRPVTVGATAASTVAAIQHSKEAQELGAAAVMVSPPPMGKPNPDAVFAHYSRLADAIDIPIVVQDYPSSSGVHMSPDFIARLSSGIPAARYLKLEDPPTPPKISAIRKLVGDDMPIFGGLGGVFLLEELARGSAGAMTGFAYPEVLVEICRHMAEGDQAKAEEVFNRCLPLMLFEFQEGIGVSVRKYALQSRGLIECSKVRHPGPNITDETKAEFHRLVGAVGLSAL
ncbi:MAG: dihydrodipicolinate synthase family protein [SAR202 cluster bacterium]|nr:dihydrodipicolinate synthase family protein [SAR202 cluster bacterium]